MQTPRDFDRDQRICDAASKGRWSYDSGLTDETTNEYGKPPAIYCLCEKRGLLWIAEPSSYNPYDEGSIYVISQEEADANGMFIAEAKQGWPAALEEIRVLRGLLADMQIDSKAYQLGYEQAKKDTENSFSTEVINSILERKPRKQNWQTFLDDLKAVMKRDVDLLEQHIQNKLNDKK